jgi:hypothetical protein
VISLDVFFLRCLREGTGVPQASQGAILEKVPECGEGVAIPRECRSSVSAVALIRRREWW